MSCGAPLAASDSKAPSAPAPAPTGATQAGSIQAKVSGAFRNAIDLVKDPAAYMTKNKDIGVSLNWMIINYVAIIAAVPFVATLIGDSYRYSTFGRDAVGGALAVAIATYILQVLGVVIFGWVMWKLAPSFASKTDQTRATIFAAWAWTPIALVSIVDLVPAAAILTILGFLYGLYILYLGIPILLGTPKDRVITYMIVLLIVSFIIYEVIALIIGDAAHAALVANNRVSVPLPA
jgi:hypothetical protein